MELTFLILAVLFLLLLLLLLKGAPVRAFVLILLAAVRLGKPARASPSLESPACSVTGSSTSTKLVGPRYPAPNPKPCPFLPRAALGELASPHGHG